MMASCILSCFSAVSLALLVHHYFIVGQMLKPEIEACMDYCQTNTTLACTLLSTDRSSHNRALSNTEFEYIFF